MAKKNPTGILSYNLGAGNASNTFDLWIDSITQSNSLSGNSSQSRLTKHFYPHAHMPGDYVLEGTASSQKDYQNLAIYIRNHQVAMMNQPVDESFTRVAGAGFRRLLTLSVPSEGLWIRGFVPRFTLTKRGVFEPAPKFTFNFFVVFDSHSTDIRLSSEIRKYFTGGFDSAVVRDTPQNDTPTVTAPPGGFAANKPLP